MSRNGYTRSNRRRFNVDITSIRRRPNLDEFPRHFHVLFRCNFASLKIRVVSTYFFRCNFDGRKIHMVSTYLFRCNFYGRKISDEKLELNICKALSVTGHEVKLDDLQACQRLKK